MSPTKKRDHSSARGGQQQHDYYLDAALAWTGVLMEALFCCLITQPRRVRLNERAFLCFDLKLCCMREISDLAGSNIRFKLQRGDAKKCT